MKKTVGVLSLIVMLLSQVFSPFAYAVSGEEVPIQELVVEEIVPETEVVEPEVAEPEVIPEDGNSTGDDSFEVVEQSIGEVADLVEPVDVEFNTGTVISSGEETKNLEEESLTGTEASSGFIEKITETIKDFLGINGEEDSFESKEIYGTGEYEGVKVEVYAQTGLFASGTELTIEPVLEEKLQAVQEVLLSGEVNLVEKQVIAFDITFRDPETQEELQPKDGTVQVKFNYEENESLVQAEDNEEQEVKVYHLNDIDEEGEKIEEITGAKLEEVIINEEKSEEENVMVVEANSFSIYTIVQQVKEEGPLATEDQLSNFEYGEISIARPDNLNSSEYPIEGFTIMDRNLGAKSNVISTNAGPVTNTGSYGYKYQRGNNYGFSQGCWNNGCEDSIYLRAKNVVESGASFHNLMNNSGYRGTTFIVDSTYRDYWKSEDSYPHYDGLWGGSGDLLYTGSKGPSGIYWDDGNDRKLRQGPCPEGWHVPSAGERSMLIYYWYNSGASEVLNPPKKDNLYYFSESNNVLNFMKYFKIPLAGYRDYLNAKVYFMGTNAILWSSSPASVNSSDAWRFGLSDNGYGIAESNIKSYRTSGNSVRCFKNTYSGTGDVHTITFNFNGGSGSTAAINVLSGEKAIEPEIPVKEGYVFDGWYKEDTYENKFNFDDNVIIEDIELYAKWKTYSTLISGKEFNSRIKGLANSSSYYNIMVSDYKIKKIVRGETPIDGAIDISTGSSIPIKVWFEEDTIYYYSDAEIIFMNEDSSSMFQYFNSLETLDLSSFDTSKVTDMSSMFFYCVNLLNLDLSTFNTSNVIDMNNMFYYCEKLTTLDLSNFDTSKVENMNSMFYFCSGLTSINISEFNTNNVKNMNSMFYGLRLLTALDLTNFNTSKVTDMGYMFNYCTNLEYLNLSSFNTSHVTTMNGMFYDCRSLDNLDLSSFDTELVEDFSFMFQNCTSLKNINISSFRTTSATKINNMFYENDSLERIDLSHFDTSKVTKFSYALGYCDNLEYANIDGWNFVNLGTDWPSIFSRSPKLKEISMKGIKLPVDFSNGLTRIGANNVEKIDVSNRDLEGTETVDNLFYNIKSLKTIVGLGEWVNYSSLQDISEMFYNCNGLKTIYSNDDSLFKKSLNSNSMFYDVPSILGGNGTKYDSTKTDKTYAKIDKEGQVGYFTDPSHFAIRIKNQGGEEITTQWISTGGKAKALTGRYFGYDYYIKTGDNEYELFDLTTPLYSYTEIYASGTDAYEVKFYSGDDVIYTGYVTGDNNSKLSILPEDLVGGVGNEFVGWYEKNGDEYLDEPFDFTGTAITGDIELYAKWNKYAVLLPGKQFNMAIKSLSKGYEVYTYASTDSKINRFERSQTLTTSYATRKISTGSVDVFAWYDNAGTIYYFSEDNNEIYYNEDSSYMFYELYSLKSFDVRQFNTKNVKDMSYMFYEAFSFTDSVNGVVIDFRGMDLNNLESTNRMFMNAFKNSNDVSNVSIYFNNLNLTGVTTIYGMFRNSFQSVGLISNVTIDLSHSDLSNATNMGYLFNSSFSNAGSISGVNISLSHTKLGSVQDPDYPFQSMFSTVKYLQSLTLDLSDIDLSGLLNTKYMFQSLGWSSSSDSRYLTGLTIDLSNANLSNVIDVSKMFGSVLYYYYDGAISGVTIDFYNADLSGLPSTNSLFLDFASASYNVDNVLIDFRKAKMGNVTDLQYMFKYLIGNAKSSSNIVINFSGADLSRALNLKQMFYYSNVTDLEFGNLSFSNVTDMHQMFQGSKKLTVLDLRNWNTSNVTDMYQMFYGTEKLKTIYASESFSTQNVSSSNSYNMFYNTTSLVGGNGTKYNSSVIDKTYAKIDKEGQLGYFTDPNNFSVRYFTKDGTTVIKTEGNKKRGDDPNGLSQNHTTYQYYTGKDETTPVTLASIDLQAYTELYVEVSCDSDDYGLIGTTCYEKHPIIVVGSGSTLNVTSTMKAKYLSGENVTLTFEGTPDGNITWSSTPSIAITSTNSGHTISFTMPDSNITLTPSMTLYHKVTYHVTANGGNATEDIVREKLVEGNPVDLTLTATKTDYSFEGWNTIQDSHEKLSTLAMGTADIDLYPIFKKGIIATFSGNGNTIANQQSEFVEECYRYNVEPTCSVVVPVIDNNAYTSIISGYSMDAATGSEIATIGTVTLDAATVAGGTASIDISDDITLYAQTYEPEVIYTVTYQKGEGDDARGVIDFVPYNDSCIIAAIYNGNNNVEQATGCEVELPTISIATGYHTPLWYKQGEDTSYSGANITLTGDIILEAKAIANNYTVVYKPGEGTGEMESQEFEYDKEESLNKNKYRKEGYHFSGWIDLLGKEYRDGEKVLNLLTEGVLELTAQWLQNPPAAGGGQSITPATKEQEHNAAEEKPEDKQESNQDKQQDETVKDESKTPENTNTSNQTNTQQSSSTSPDNSYKTVVDPEIQSAYEWAYERDVTTIPSLDDAMPDGVVKRGHLAKMVVNYATNVLGREIPEKIPSECRWNDWRKDRESEEIKDYAVKSCALGLMGLDMPKFLPNMEVTRAQFGTIMSRLLWGKKYAGGTPYYRKHLNALKENNIMTQIENPERRVELRQWVWLMLMRSAQNK